MGRLDVTPFWIALQFLTRLPVPAPEAPTDSGIGRSLLYYPLVGLILGLLLVGLGWALRSAPGLLSAALLLAAWVLLTGGLHLDGLADSADAWVGGLGDRERTLAIMKDPYCGPAGVSAIVIVLILKLAALAALVAQGDWPALLPAPLLGRTALPMLFVSTAYVRPGGLGAALASHAERRMTMGVLAATALAVLFFSSGPWMLLTTAIGFLLFRTALIHRIGGTTGDTAGALVELTETLVLLTLVLI
jgi:adenosylcobinamide-GDP ribazoletransferase